MKKMGLFWFAAALLGAALIFGGCETEADTETVTVREGVTNTLLGLQELLDTDGVNYVKYLGSLTIGNTLVIPAGKTVTVSGAVTVNGVLAVGGTLTLTGTITNNGIVIGSDAFIADLDGTTYAAVASLPTTDAEFEALGKSVTAVENLTLKKGTPLPAWYDYDLTVYVYGTLTVEGDATAPASDASVVAIGNVLIDGSEAAVATLNTAKINVSNATITLNANKTVTVTLPSPLTGPTFKVTGESGLLKVTGPTVINNVRVTNNNGFVEFISNVTEANISGDGRVRFSGAAAFATNASTITAGLVEFTDTSTGPSFGVAGSSITAEKITFTKGLTLSAGLVLDGNIVLPDATAEIGLGTSALTLKTGSTITVKDAIVLTATTDSTLTGSLAGAKITPVLAAAPAPAKLQFDGTSASTITLGGTLEAGSLKLGTNGSAIVAAGATLSLGSGSTLDAGALILGEGAWKATIATATISADTLTLGNNANAAFGKDDGTTATVLTGGAATTNTFTASGASATVTLSQSGNALAITGNDAAATLTTGANAGIKVKAALTITTATVDISAADTSIIALEDGSTGITLANATSIIVLDASKTTATSGKKAITGLTVGADVVVKAEDDTGGKDVGSFTGAADNNTIAESGSTTFEIKKGITTTA